MWDDSFKFLIQIGPNGPFRKSFLTLLFAEEDEHENTPKALKFNAVSETVHVNTEVLRKSSSVVRFTELCGQDLAWLPPGAPELAHFCAAQRCLEEIRHPSWLYLLGTEGTVHSWRLLCHPCSLKRDLVNSSGGVEAKGLEFSCWYKFVLWSWENSILF